VNRLMAAFRKIIHREKQDESPEVTPPDEKEAVKKQVMSYQRRVTALEVQAQVQRGRRK
jgi:hypothetical protein